MRRIHVFNPDHDLALAFGAERFTSPAAGRLLRHDLAFLPAFWSGKDDVVAVDDMDVARKAVETWGEWFEGVTFLPLRELGTLFPAQKDESWEVHPWGWNAALRLQLSLSGVPEEILPSKERIARIRTCSHRQQTIDMLHAVVEAVPLTVGRRFVVHRMEEVREWLSRLSSAVVKAPWSSSGRGVRFVTPDMTDNVEGFIKRVIERQGSIIVEPCYDRVVDFGMEYVADGQGNAVFTGLSLFDTRHGAYLGNLLAEEGEKRRRLAQWLPDGLLDEVRDRLLPWLGKMCEDTYSGPLGVDMMVVRTTDGFRLHPCVEVNLRQTMGHAALDIAARTQGRYGMMRVMMDKGCYVLRLEK